MAGMKIFFSVGEPSGDLHGANLIHELKKRHRGIECVGYGGPRMAAAGCQLHADLTQLAVMWIARVILNIHKFLGLLIQADRYFKEQRPDAVVLIDYPGFNWWIARRAKAQGILVFYYGAPQIWAWASWRIRKLRRLTDFVLCKLPFEEKWFRDRGCNAKYVGHPFFDELSQRQLDNSFLNRISSGGGPLVTILPGSRNQEVAKNLRWLIKATVRIREQLPHVRFAVASFNASQADVARRMVLKRQMPIDVYVNQTPELIQAADVCLACSGSVSLELLYHTKPAVILYWVDRLSYWFQSKLRRVRYITLVNLIGMEDPCKMDVSPLSRTEQERLPMPEYLTYQDKSAEIAAHIVRWLSDPRAFETQQSRLGELRSRFGQSGASAKAADLVLENITSKQPPVPKPHFVPGKSAVPISSGEPATPL
jgi:lipid-A-disaccharide synthase